MDPGSPKVAQVAAPEEGAEFDFSLLEHTLRMTYEERIEAHEAALQLVNDLAEAGRELRAKQPQTVA